MKTKGFTLIELLAVIVILAIVSLIATPIILNIIHDARTSSTKRTAELIGREVVLAYSNYMLSNPVGASYDPEEFCYVLDNYFHMDGADLEIDEEYCEKSTSAVKVTVGGTTYGLIRETDNIDIVDDDNQNIVDLKIK